MTGRVIYSEHNQRTSRTSLSASLWPVWSQFVTIWGGQGGTIVSKLEMWPMEAAALGRQCLNAEQQVPTVLLSVGDILENT